jgi:hypothetical protein
LELTNYLESLSREEIPVVLVSQTQRRSVNNWPESIREFVSKSLGPFAILEALFEAHEAAVLARKMKRQFAAT